MRSLILLITSVAGELSATPHDSEADALSDVRDELIADYDAPDDLDAERSELADYIGNKDLDYTFAIQTLGVPAPAPVPDTFTFEAQGDQTVIYAEADDTCTALVVVAFGEETLEDHQARVRVIVDAMNRAAAGGEA